MFYLITTAAAFVGTSVSVKAMMKRFDQEGYEYHKKKKTKEEEKLDTVKALAVLLCPGVNIIFASILVFGFEKIYEGFKENLIREKTLVKKEEKKPEEKKEDVNVDMQTNELNRTRNYSDLSAQEKLAFLEEEKQRLLSQKETPKEEKATTSYNARGAYSKKM